MIIKFILKKEIILIQDISIQRYYQIRILIFRISTQRYNYFINNFNFYFTKIYL